MSFELHFTYPDDPKQVAVQYQHNLVYEISRIRMDIPVEEINWDEIVEAYFFSETAELHVFKEEENIKAVEATEKGEPEHFVDEKYNLENKFLEYGKTVKIRKYLEFDKDGQCFVAYTRLVEIQ